jgi:hypothetical protein
MKNLPQYAKHLLLQGASTLGNFTEGFCFVEEEIKVKDSEELFEFCKWIDNRIGGASRNNIEMLFWLSRTLATWNLQNKLQI